MRVFAFILLLIIGCFSIPASAVTVEDLYQVKLPVNSQDGSERKQAIEQAFSVLLVRVTGNRNIDTLPEGQKLIASANQYVRQFRYEKAPPVKKDPSSIAGFGAQPTPGQLLVVLFDEEVVKQALWRNRLPVWGKVRPATLVWMAVQDEERRYLLDANEAGDVVEQLRKIAERRGLPLVFPLLDLEDQININVNDVWGDFADPILAASMRYQTEAVLAGRLFIDSSGQWNARWTLYHANNTLSWRSDGQSMLDVLLPGIGGVAEDLAVRYASISSGDDNIMQINVSGIKSLQDYVRVNQYLESLSQISHARIIRLSLTDAIFRVELRGNKGSLEKAIALGQTFTLNREALAEVSTNTLYYHLAP